MWKSFADFKEQQKKIVQQSHKIVILDQITDVGNIGAIIRSSVAFGITDIFIPEHNSLSDYGLLAKASSGIVEKVNIYVVTNLKNLLQDLKKMEFWCVGLDGDAKVELKNMPHYKKFAIILGNEGKGIRPLLKKECDLLVKVAMSKSVESLNVSNAAAIMFYNVC